MRAEVLSVDYPVTDSVRTCLWWDSPLAGTFKLNIDGSFVSSTRLMGVGGVLRDSNGGWQWGFSGNYGYGCSIHAELLALHIGLDFAWEQGHKNLIVETYSLEVLHLVTSGLAHCGSYMNLVLDIKLMLNKCWQVHLRHVFREANMVADYLAKLKIREPCGLSFWTTPPLGASDLLLIDNSV
ncbi:Ribonuclease H domain [Sesbania bispinosa]|nr:Ribonuclease H domain [Sesbania bispinosa]